MWPTEQIEFESPGLPCTLHLNTYLLFQSATWSTCECPAGNVGASSDKREIFKDTVSEDYTTRRVRMHQALLYKVTNAPACQTQDDFQDLTHLT